MTKDYVRPDFLSDDELRQQITQRLMDKRWCRLTYDEAHERMNEDRLNELLEEVSKRHDRHD